MPYSAVTAAVYNRARWPSRRTSRPPLPGRLRHPPTSISPRSTPGCGTRSAARVRPTATATRATAPALPSAASRSVTGRSRRSGRSNGVPASRAPWAIHSRAAQAVPALVRRAVRVRAAHVQRCRAQAHRRAVRGARARRSRRRRPERAGRARRLRPERTHRRRRRADVARALPMPATRCPSGSTAPRRDRRRRGGSWTRSRSGSRAPSVDPTAGFRARVAPQPAAAAFPDYFAFESKLRGRTESVKERQQVYVDDFRDAAPVLDVGCGRGRAARAAPGRGRRGARDRSRRRHGRVRARRGARRRRRPTRSSYLESLEDGSLGGIFMGQVVEHLPAPMLVRTLELAAHEAAAGRGARRRDDQSALAARAAQLLRRPDACAAARSRDARVARAAGRVRVGRDALPQPAARVRTASTRRSRRSSSRRSTTRSSPAHGRVRISVCSPQVPFARGGAEILAERLTTSCGGTGTRRTS